MTDTPKEIWLSLIHNDPSFSSEGVFVWLRQKTHDDDIKYVREDKVLNSNTKIIELEAEVARCHARLEIDHQSVVNPDPQGEPLIREEISHDQRDKIPDGITCRNETIKLLDERIEKQSRRLESYAGMVAVPAPVWQSDLCMWVNTCVGKYQRVTNNGPLCHQGISTIQIKSSAWFDNEKDARDYVEKCAILALDARRIEK